MTIAHPITRAWVSTGGTGAKNYDEFADDAEITAIIAANPASALAVEMPHRTPEAVAARQGFAAALPAAAERLAALQSAGRYRPADTAVGVYRITGAAGAAYGVICMVDTDQISTSADEPGLVIRNEDVFVEKVRERVALVETTRHLLSAVLLLQSGNGVELHTALAEITGELGPCDIANVDEKGDRHEVWVLGRDPQAAPVADRLLALAGGGELIVADGNHRSLAAQTAGLPRFLAVVTTPQSVTIQPYHRLIAEVPALDQLISDLTAAGATVTPRDGRPDVPPAGGTIALYLRAEGAATGQGYAVTLPVPPAGDVVDRMDHTIVERVLFGDVLGLDPGDKRITYVGGDYPASWLCDEVDAGRAAAAVLIAPVTVDDFVAVNLDRQKMPRKSTWFTPKARAGLLVCEVLCEVAAPDSASR